MGVILQAAYRQAYNKSVPAPVDKDTPNAPWWYDHIASQANDLRKAGFSAVLTPPVLKTNAGSFPGADGYGPFDDYDIGNKNQFYSIATRFGTREQLARMTAVLRANGIDTYIDTVPHQRMGGSSAGFYEYLGSDGKTKNGRFSKHPSCFVGNPPGVPRDPIAGPVPDDFSFGAESAPINALPKGYMMNGLIDAGDWLTRSLGIEGYRVDDVKGMAVEFVSKWLNSKSMQGKIGIAEYYDGNPQTLNWWVWESGMNGRCYVFDFNSHFAVQAMCNNTSRWNMEQLQHAGLFRISPMQSVTFVENPDTDTDEFATVVWNKMLGYAWILTSEGYPSVYYKDYSTDAGCYGLKPYIDNLIWMHENLAFGQTWTRFADYQAYVYERQGYPGLLVGLNNDQYNGWREITVPTSFGSNVQLHDYTGHSGDVWTDQNGRVTIKIPPNNNGMSYVCYSRVGYTQEFIPIHQQIIQKFQGAEDLDILPALNGNISVGRIWCQKNTLFSLQLYPSTAVTIDDAWSIVPSLVNDETGAITETIPVTGWYTIQVVSSGLPPEGVPFTIVAKYTASQTI